MSSKLLGHIEWSGVGSGKQRYTCFADSYWNARIEKLLDNFSIQSSHVPHWKYDLFKLNTVALSYMHFHKPPTLHRVLPLLNLGIRISEFKNYLIISQSSISLRNFCG